MKTFHRYFKPACLGLMLAGSLPSLALAQAAPQAATVRLTGAVGSATAFDLQALKSLPQQRIEIEGKVYDGVGLWDVVSAGKPVPPAGLRNPMLSMVVIARGSDGYQTVFSMGEIDPAVGAKQVLVAHSVDGTPLPESAGPARLVVTGERKPSRAVFKLVELELRSVR